MFFSKWTKGLVDIRSAKLRPPSLNEGLPDDVVPVHYDLQLKPNFEQGTFDGWVTIILDVTKETNVIKCHMQNLVIQVGLKAFGKRTSCSIVKIVNFPDVENNTVT